MVVRKLYVSGNAVVLTLPGRVLRALGWNAGDYVAMVTDVSRKCLVLRLVPRELASSAIASAAEKGEKFEEVIRDEE
ncbi:MAG TPA: hypothetical protein EYP19_10135 [Desulfobacterales bacterium]|nr:hypothetical protein [Desulfobacterales bacterium]